jgi:hypothetical protein
LAFIGEAVEQICESMPPVPAGLDASLDQLLGDLEQLEWIVLGDPRQGAHLLDEMYPRYAPAPAPRDGEPATLWYRMRQHLARLRHHG